MKLTPDQYNELKAAQDRLQQAQADVQRVWRLLGLDSNKVYNVTIAVEEVVSDPPINTQDARDN